MRELGRRHTATLASDPIHLREAREWLVGLMLDEGFAAQDGHDLAVAFSEACANVHLHAYGGRSDGRLELAVTIEDDCVVVALDHDGRPFDPARVSPPDLRRPSEGGYGMYLIASLVDEVLFGEPGSGRRLALVKRMRRERCEGDHA